MGEEISHSTTFSKHISASITGRQKKTTGTAGRDGCCYSGGFQEGDGYGGRLADYIREAGLRK